MSAAFSLSPSGPPAPCGYPGCTAEAFHEGEHQISPREAPPRPQPVYHCVVCGLPFVVYGEHVASELRTCGTPACVLHFAVRDAKPFPLLCPCPQRPYPHELRVHQELRREAYNPKLGSRWPWSLCRSDRVEMSAERKAA